MEKFCDGTFVEVVSTTGDNDDQEYAKINQMRKRRHTVKKCVLTIKNTRRRFMDKRNLLSSLLVFLTPIVIFGQSISGIISEMVNLWLEANIVVEVRT